MIKISDYLKEENINLNLAAATKDESIKELAEVFKTTAR